MVSYGMNQVLPRQRTPPAAPATGRCSTILIRDAEPIETGRPGGREMEDELVAVVQVAIAVDWLVVPDGQVAFEAGVRAGQVASDAPKQSTDPVDDVLQPRVIGPPAPRPGRKRIARLRSTFKNNDPSGRRIRAAAATHVWVHSR